MSVEMGIQLSLEHIEKPYYKMMYNNSYNIRYMVHHEIDSF